MTGRSYGWRNEVKLFWPWEAQTRLELSFTVNSFVFLWLFWCLCWLFSMLGLRFPHYLVFPLAQEIATLSGCKLLSYGSFCQHIGMIKISSNHGSQFCITCIVIPHDWAFVWLWEKKNNPTNLLWIEQNNLPCICATFYMLFVLLSPY